MNTPALARSKKGSIPVYAVDRNWKEMQDLKLSPAQVTWVSQNGFSGKPGQMVKLPDEDGSLAAVLYSPSDKGTDMSTGTLASKLPKGRYQLLGDFGDPHLASLGWLLGAYTFDRYRKNSSDQAELVLPEAVDKRKLLREAEAAFLARDLINTPTSDLGPDELESEIRRLAKQNAATVTCVKGDALIKKNFPMIHAVGRASSNAPRLIDLKWGNPKHPKLTLVGKGVVFDTGGLNIKPGNSMALMKKDMGGAANTIALAKMVMEAKLPVRLRLLVPTVENAISGNAFRPGDILPSRKGISVEIGNTDAEGRLILADAMALADEEKPDLMIDMATLTGAARVALGPDLPPFYTHDEELAGKLAATSMKVQDPLWHMPLWEPYQKMLSSRVADVNHISAGGFAGSITAALFLSRFVEHASSWVHLDIFGWVPADKPWAKVGGEAQGIRALYKVIEDRYLK